jgi:hypothetical protein
MRHNKAIAATALMILIIGRCTLIWGLPAGQEKHSGKKSLPQVSELKINSWVEPGLTVVKTQQVRLVIEISTPTWFAEGTRITPFDLSDALVLEAGQLATNFTRNEKEGPWSVQQWTFFIYPLKEKTYSIPEIHVATAVADAKGGPSRPVEAWTRPVRFSAFIPADLQTIENWVAAERMSVHEQYSAISEVYKVGDALERRIDIEAEGLPAMMISALTENSIPGLAIYPDPPTIADNANRGLINGKRTERIAYVVEKPGTYRIPERIYAWYNIQTGQLETASLPEKIIATKGNSPSLPGAHSDLAEKFKFFAYPVLMACAGILICLAFLVYRHGKGKSGPSVRDLKRALKKAVKNQNKEEAVRILYQWFDHRVATERDYTHWRQLLRSTHGPEELQCFDRFMAFVYGPDSTRKPLSLPQVKKLAALLNHRNFERRCLKNSFLECYEEKTSAQRT